MNPRTARRIISRMTTEQRAKALDALAQSDPAAAERLRKRYGGDQMTTEKWQPTDPTNPGDQKLADEMNAREPQPRAWVVQHGNRQSYLGRYGHTDSLLSFVPFAYAVAFDTIEEAESARKSNRTAVTTPVATIEPLYATGKFGALSLKRER